MREELLKELSEYIEWDPSDTSKEPTVNIDGTKVIHAFKRHFKATYINFEDTALGHVRKDPSLDTLYKVLKKVPMGSLLLYADGILNSEDILGLIADGVQPCGTFKFYPDYWEKAYDKPVDEWVDQVRKASQKIYSLRTGVKTPKTETVSLTLPNTGERAALNTILSSVKMPSIETLVGMAKDNTEAVKKIEDAKALSDAEVATLKGEVDKLKSEVKDLFAKAQVGNQVQEEVASHDGSIPSGKTTFKKASEVFKNIKFSSDFEIPVWEWDGVHPLVPAIDPYYKFRPNLLSRVLYALVTNQRGYLQGHTGSGKTTLLEQVAAHLNFPFVRVNFDSEVTRMDLIGRDTLKSDGKGSVSSQFVDGILPAAMNSPCIFCADEIDFVRPDVAYVMQAALEGNGLRITEDGDRMVKPHPMFRMFATGNTVGQGDEFGMYQGARPQSLALLDRFTVWIKVDYLSKKDREELVARHFPALTNEEATILSKYMEEHLEAFSKGTVIQPISPRGMLAVAKATIILGSIKEAMNMTILDRANADDYAVLKGLVDRVTP